MNLFQAFANLQGYSKDFKHHLKSESLGKAILTLSSALTATPLNVQILKIKSTLSRGTHPFFIKPT